MADPRSYPDANDDTGDDTSVAPDRGSTTSTPRWVKVFGIIALVLVLLMVVMLLIGGGHGPGRHAPPSSGHENTGGAGGPADADGAARTVEGTILDTMTFEPSRSNLSAGETVRFVR